MICYKDRAFCSRPLNECTCADFRKITPEVDAAAKEWWRGMEGDPPFCVAELCVGKRTKVIKGDA